MPCGPGGRRLRVTAGWRNPRACDTSSLYPYTVEGLTVLLYKYLMFMCVAIWAALGYSTRNDRSIKEDVLDNAACSVWYVDPPESLRSPKTYVQGDFRHASAHSTNTVHTILLRRCQAQSMRKGIPEGSPVLTP